MYRRKLASWTMTIGVIGVILVVNSPSGLAQVSRAPRGSKRAPTPASSAQLKALADQQFAAGVYKVALSEYLDAYPAYRNSFEVNQRIVWLYEHETPPETKSALPYLRQAHRLKPGDPLILQDLARTTAAEKLFKEAIPLYRQWLATSPAGTSGPWLEFARLLSWNGQTHEAIAAYRRYLSRVPKNLAARTELAKLLSQEKDYRGAQNQYNYVLRIDSKNIPARIGTAQILAWRGKVAEGLREIDAVLRVAPHNFDARLAKAYDLLWLGKDEAAGALFADLHKEAPRNGDVVEGLKEVEAAQKSSKQSAAKKEKEDKLRLAERNESQGKYDEAISDYQAYLADHPNDADAQFRLGRVLAWDQRYADSEAVLVKWVDQHPRNPEGYLQLARVYNWDRDYHDAAQNYWHYLALKPKDTAARLELAGALLAMPSYHDAAGQYQTVLEMEPQNSDALEGLTRTETASGDFVGAEKTLATLRTQKPKSDAIPQLDRHLEDAQLNKAQELGPANPKAVQILNRLVAAHPKNTQARLVLVDFDLSRKDYSPAIENLREAIALSPKNDALRVKLAEVLSWNKQFKESASQYRELAASHPDNPQIRLQLARVLSWEKDYPDSLAEYGKLLKADPTNHELRLEEARIFAWSKQYDRAVQELQTLLRQKPDDFDALLELGQVYAYESDWPKSLTALDRALKVKPGDYDARLAKAQTLVWSGDGEAGERLLVPLRAEKPKDVTALLVMASAQNATGRPDHALALLKSARSLSPGNPDVNSLYSAIEDPLRPELSLGWSYLRDNESLNVWRYELDARFSLTPRLRNFVTVDVLPTSAPADTFGYPVAGATGLVFSPRVPADQPIPGPGVLGANAFPSALLVPGNVRIHQNAIQFLAGGSMKVNSWFSWTAGFGMITLRHGTPDLASQGFASTDSHFIYRVSPAFQWGRTFRLQFTASRQYWPYTPRSISERIHANEEALAVTYTPTLRSRIKVSGFHRNILPGFKFPTVGSVVGGDFKMHGNGVEVTGTYDIFKGEAAQLAVGYDGTALGYNHPNGLPFPSYYVNPGAFTPSFYQRHAALTRLDLHPFPLLDLDLHGTAGPQQINHGGKFSLSYTAGTKLDLHLSPKATLSLTYDYFDAASAFLAVPINPAQTPAYHSNSVGATLHFKF